MAGTARARLVGRAHRLLQRLGQRREPVVTNGDARLAAIARERGWPTLQLFELAAE
jgi:hypothetical protein